MRGRLVSDRSAIRSSYDRRRRDLVVPARNARELLGLARDGRAVVIDGSHLALATNPQASAAAMVTFMRDRLGG